MLKPHLFLLLLLAVSITTLPAFADDDDDFEFGESENEYDDDETRLGTGGTDMILYGTIAAITGTVGYTGFKILRSKKPTLVK